MAEDQPEQADSASVICNCPKCRINRILELGSDLTVEQRTAAIWALAHVLGAELARCDDQDLINVLHFVSNVRHLAQRRAGAGLNEGQSGAGLDLAAMEVAGHG